MTRFHQKSPIPGFDFVGITLTGWRFNSRSNLDVYQMAHAKQAWSFWRRAEPGKNNADNPMEVQSKALFRNKVRNDLVWTTKGMFLHILEETHSEMEKHRILLVKRDQRTIESNHNLTLALVRSGLLSRNNTCFTFRKEVHIKATYTIKHTPQDSWNYQFPLQLKF